MEKMGLTRDDRKRYYDRDYVERTFKTGNKVLIYLVLSKLILSVNWIGPGTIDNQISETYYAVNVTSKRAQSQIYT